MSTGYVRAGRSEDDRTYHAGMRECAVDRAHLSVEVVAADAIACAARDSMLVCVVVRQRLTC